MKKTRVSTVARSARSASESRRREARFSRTPNVEVPVEHGFIASPRLPNLLRVPVHPPGAEPVLRRMGAELRQDFSNVKIEPRSHEAERLDAFAFARNEEVHFAPGQYRPETPVGRRLFGHELVHIAQQRRGRVETTAHEGETPTNDQPELEQEAQRRAEHAAFAGAGEALPPPTGGGPPRATTPQPAQLSRGRSGRRDRSASPGRRRAARSRSRSRDRDRNRNRQETEVDRLARRTSLQLKSEWDGIIERTNKTLDKIREIDAISQASPRPRRLSGQDRRIANRLERLNTRAQRHLDNIEILDRALGRRQDPRRDDDKRGLAEIIVEGRELERELGVVSSQSEARLGPRDFQGNTATHRYHTGAAADPIPIVWYKNPDTDYDSIVIPAGNAANVTAGTYNYPDGPAFPTSGARGAFQIRVADENQPELNDAAGFELIKQPLGSRPARTPYKDTANAALRTAGFDLRAQIPRLDGDHVRDLGFGGDDAYDNYWPLDEDINRRAFHGYNANYIINFIDHTKDTTQANPNGNPNGRPVSQAIGGMAGRHFVVKEYLDANADPVPEESESVDAGTA